ncbi:autotransporter outer membrane beta-barrel domain-containing protein [Aestuariibius sp. 2305UL40-4]|uniref:autotransporter outer membrane beta-barrel domain-containing protein n=1 Tax=Aestuariibius violaceus TaxID=3234132 RepID=UPI00345EB80A
MVIFFDRSTRYALYFLAASALPAAAQVVDDGQILEPRIPGIAGVTNNVTITQSLMAMAANDAIFNRPSSPFVVGLAFEDEDNCGKGVWGRSTIGTADLEGDTTVDGSVTLPTELEMDYYGVQLGGDYACFNGFYNGWDLAFGLTGGVNVGDTEQPVFELNGSGTGLTDTQSSTTETDFTQRYLGVYMVANRGPFSADIQLRFEDAEFDIENDPKSGFAGLGLDTEFDSTGYTLSGAASYVVPFRNSDTLAFIPAAGFAISRTDTDDIGFEDGSRLEIGETESNLGFIGGTIAGAQIAPDGLSATTYFGTATIYNDFADDQEARFVDGGTVGELEYTTLETYGELSAGVNYTRILDPGDLANARQLNASVRADARFGEFIEGYGLTAQVRLQF